MRWGQGGTSPGPRLTPRPNPLASREARLQNMGDPQTPEHIQSATQDLGPKASWAPASDGCPQPGLTSAAH